MKKLSLSLDTLQVESFDTSAAHPARGTVQGNTGYISECYCTGGWCAGETAVPCEAGTYAGQTCDSTCNQIACGCTGGGFLNGTCDVTCATCHEVETCYQTCETYATCPTSPGYHGC